MGSSGFSLILVLIALLGLACTVTGKKKLLIKEIDIFQEDPNYSEVQECDVKYSAKDPDTAVWTFIWKVKKELPESSMISIESFRKESNGYGSYLYRIPESPANYFLEDASIYKEMRDTGNFPAKFPFPEGTYSINEYNFKQPSYLAMESNDYYFEVNLTIPDDQDSNTINILGMRLFINVK